MTSGSDEHEKLLNVEDAGYRAGAELEPETCAGTRHHLVRSPAEFIIFCALATRTPEPDEGLTPQRIREAILAGAAEGAAEQDRQIFADTAAGLEEVTAVLKMVGASTLPPVTVTAPAGVESAVAVADTPQVIVKSGGAAGSLRGEGNWWPPCTRHRRRCPEGGRWKQARQTWQPRLPNSARPASPTSRSSRAGGLFSGASRSSH